MILAPGNLRSDGVHFSPEEAGRRWPTHHPTGGASTSPHKLRVMIVEDELFVAMHLESVLEELGHEVTAVLSTGERALDEFPRLQPDIILMDINLGGGIDGITAAQQIRLAGDVQIVFVSAYSDAGTRARVEAALPGSKLLSKPVTPGILMSAIQEERRH